MTIPMETAGNRFEPSSFLHVIKHQSDLNWIRVPLPETGDCQSPSLTGYRRPRLTPKLAVVLTGDVAPHALPGEVARTVPGTFLALSIAEEKDSLIDPAAADHVPGSLILGEQLLPLDVHGSLHLRVNGEVVATETLQAQAELLVLIEQVAAQADGLRAMDTILIGSRWTGVPAQPGTVLLTGPRGTSLSATLEGEG